MRGECQDQGGLFCYIDPESRIPGDHPLRQVRTLVRAVLKDVSGSFAGFIRTAAGPRSRRSSC
jgi:hypothetical protein